MEENTYGCLFNVLYMIVLIIHFLFIKARFIAK